MASPKKARTAGQVTLKMEVLRQILAEQSEGLMKAHDNQLNAALQKMEDKQKAMFQTLRGRIDQTSCKLDAVETKVDEFEKRLT